MFPGPEECGWSSEEQQQQRDGTERISHWSRSPGPPGDVRSGPMYELAIIVWRRPRPDGCCALCKVCPFATTQPQMYPLLHSHSQMVLQASTIWLSLQPILCGLYGSRQHQRNSVHMSQSSCEESPRSETSTGGRKEGK
ncbi:unnamed protein product [Pleuronectes platessa]|uniref:Uncharacterized protein n=1 Tax=Pleuronectes platessa TaxID=8262 RepID=A0A9N7U6Y9_PLEPL|nr:unnamed protein product [Pleuronectes platessa]